jgi:hypothetical protein
MFWSCFLSMLVVFGPIGIAVLLDKAISHDDRG